MRYGRLILAVIGVAIMAVGVLVALTSSAGVGLAFMVIGLVALVLGVSDWHEFEAQLTRALKLRVATAPPPTPATPVEQPRPDVRILGIEPQGGHDKAVDFRVEVANYGTQQCRSTVTANVDGTAVTVDPSSLDLIPNDPSRAVRVLVPRPTLGNLMLPWIANETSLYDRTLTVVVSDGEREVSETWHETIFDPVEGRARAEAQQRVWRIGRGKGTEADFRAEAQSELLRRHDERLERES